MEALGNLEEGSCGCGDKKSMDSDMHPADCGCPKCMQKHGGHGMDHDMSHGMDRHSSDMHVDHQVSGMLSKEEALDLVSMIAARTTCPMTRAALEDLVDDLEPESIHDDSGMRVIPLDGMGSDDAMGLGYEAGMMGLRESNKLTRSMIRREIINSLKSLK